MIEDFLDENGGFFIGSKYGEKTYVKELKIVMMAQFHPAIPWPSCELLELGKITEIQNGPRLK